MFDHLTRFQRIIVTGPHRSGTTIASEMIAHDTGKPCIREEAFGYRDIKIAAAITEGVVQGPYLLPWLPILSGDATAIVYVNRAGCEIDASVARLKVSKPFYHWSQGRALWHQVAPLLDNAHVVQYGALRKHPLWTEDRRGWHHRQTA